MSRPENFDAAVNSASTQDISSKLHDEAYTRPQMIAGNYTDAPVPKPQTHPTTPSDSHNNTAASESRSTAAAASAARANSDSHSAAQQHQSVDGSGNSNIRNAGNSNVKIEGNRTFVAPPAPTVIPGENTSSSTYYKTEDQVLSVSGTAANRTFTGAAGVSVEGFGFSVSAGGGGPDADAMKLTVENAVVIQNDAAGTFFGRQAQKDGIAPAAGEALQAAIVRENLTRRTRPADKPAEQ